jgi:hypothetical protein
MLPGILDSISIGRGLIYAEDAAWENYPLQRRLKMSSKSANNDAIFIVRLKILATFIGWL